VIRYVMLALCDLFAMASSAAAQTGVLAWGKGWIDVNFGTASAAEKEYDSIQVRTIFQESGGGDVG